ncbi:hypothetical protein HUJ04_003179 [Dendroctonus ponderosae]|nr:hypothetical protein HUJ04_003179 [Dendroctonus ponderosae]
MGPATALDTAITPFSEEYIKNACKEERKTKPLDQKALLLQSLQSALVLIEKPKKRSNDENTYRPLCLIDVAVKILESLPKNRITEEMQQKNLEHPNQYGFTKGKATTDAIQKICEIASKCKEKSYKNRDICLMILLDMKKCI